MIEEQFNTHLKAWREETQYLSTGIFDNKNFTKIVEMGLDAIPFILKELKRQPSHLVHALDLIYPNIITYNGFVSLEQATQEWLKVFKDVTEVQYPEFAVEGEHCFSINEREILMDAAISASYINNNYNNYITDTTRIIVNDIIRIISRMITDDYTIEDAVLENNDKGNFIYTKNLIYDKYIFAIESRTKDGNPFYLNIRVTSTIHIPRKQLIFDQIIYINSSQNIDSIKKQLYEVYSQLKTTICEFLSSTNGEK